MSPRFHFHGSEFAAEYAWVYVPHLIKLSADQRELVHVLLSGNIVEGGLRLFPVLLLWVCPVAWTACSLCHDLVLSAVADLSHPVGLSFPL